MGLFQEFDNSYLRLEGVWNQDLIQPQRFALQTLPSLLWSGYQGLGNGLAFLTYNATAVNYWRQEGVGGERVDLSPQLTVPWLWGRYLNGWITAGFDAAGYDVSGHQVAIIPVGTHGRTYNNNLALGPLERGGLMGRIVPDVDAGLRTVLLGRSDLSSLGLGKVTDLVTPTVEFDYVPAVSQSRFPLFDETDRIEPRSLIFYGFSSRIFLQTGASNPNAGNFGYNVARGRTAPSFSTAGGYTEEVLRFAIQEAYDPIRTISPNGSHLSDVDVAATVFPNRVISGVGHIDWSPRSQQRLDGASVGLQFQPPGQKLPSIYTGRESIGSYVRLTYTYGAKNAELESPSSSTNAISSVNLASYLDLGSHLGAYFAPNYDIAAGRLLTDVIGLRFKSACDCWFVDLALNQSYNPNDVTFMFQITLGGLGTVGQAPFGLNPFQTAGFLPRQPSELSRSPSETQLAAPLP